MTDDIEVKVTVADDGSSAWVDGVLTKEIIPAQLHTILARLIHEANISHGLDVSSLDKVCGRLLSMKPLNEFTIAQSIPPTSGTPGRVEFLVDMDQKIVGRSDPSGHIDFRDRGDLPLVKKGQPVARLIPPIPGQQGRSVTGLSVEPPNPPTVSLITGKNTRREKDKLIATKPGHAVDMGGGRVAVLDTLTVKRINYDTGHIKHPGLVRVADCIEVGYQLKSEAAILGSVETKCKVKTEEFVRVAGGIMGARIEAGGRVTAALARKAHIISGGDVIIDFEIVDSFIEAEGKVVVESSKGRIVNSIIAAGKGVKAARIMKTSKKDCRIILGPTEADMSPHGGRTVGRAKLVVPDMAQQGVEISGYRATTTLAKDTCSFSARETRRSTTPSSRPHYLINITEVS